MDWFVYCSQQQQKCNLDFCSQSDGLASSEDNEEDECYSKETKLSSDQKLLRESPSSLSPTLCAQNSD